MMSIDFRSEFNKREKELAALQENPEDEPDYNVLLEETGVIEKTKHRKSKQESAKEASGRLSNIKQSIEVFDVD